MQKLLGGRQLCLCTQAGLKRASSTDSNAPHKLALLSQEPVRGCGWIFLHKIYCDFFFFLLSVYFVSLHLEDKPWSAFLEYKGSFPAEGMPPAHRVQLPGAEHPSGCQSQGTQHWDPFLTLIRWRTSSFFRWVKAQAKVWPPTGGSSVAFPVGVQGCSMKCLSSLSQSTGLTKGLMSKWAIWHQSPRLNCTALGTVGGKHFCAVPRKREWLSSGARRWLTGNRKQ